MIAAVPSAAFTLFRLIDRILGGSGSALSSELAIPVAVLIVASIVAAYHGRLVIADLRFTSAASAADGVESPGEPAPAEAASVAAATAAHAASPGRAR